MPYCQYCGGKTDYNAVFCPRCGECLVAEVKGWDEVQIQEEIDKAKHRANIYTILTIVLATVGMMVGAILSVSLYMVGFFGIAFVCLGVGCSAWAGRHERKARNLMKHLNQ